MASSYACCFDGFLINFACFGLFIFGLIHLSLEEKDSTSCTAPTLEDIFFHRGHQSPVLMGPVNISDLSKNDSELNVSNTLRLFLKGVRDKLNEGEEKVCLKDDFTDILDKIALNNLKITPEKCQQEQEEASKSVLTEYKKGTSLKTRETIKNVQDCNDETEANHELKPNSLHAKDVTKVASFHDETPENFTSNSTLTEDAIKQHPLNISANSSRDEELDLLKEPKDTAILSQNLSKEAAADKASDVTSSQIDDLKSADDANTEEIIATEDTSTHQIPQESASSLPESLPFIPVDEASLPDSDLGASDNTSIIINDTSINLNKSQSDLEPDEALDVSPLPQNQTDLEKSKENKTKPREESQLETYSEFAERVSAEKKNGVSGSNGHHGNGHVKGQSSKMKHKNYASTNCGSKLVSTNPESEHADKIINSNKDEYLLNKCEDKTWVIIELCESIRPQKFEVSNFELYSNMPKDIFLYGSLRYPTREWTSLGHYMGEDGNRDVQSFNIQTEEFFKFIKIEIPSHYGNEFYCPLSLFRIYGISEFEVIDQMDDDDDEASFDQEDHEEFVAVDKETKAKGNSIIPNALKSMITGILKVIQRGSRLVKINSESEEMDYFKEKCFSIPPSLTFNMSTCTAANSLNYILACYYDEYMNLLKNPSVTSFLNENLCSSLSESICLSSDIEDSFLYDTHCRSSYLCIMMSPKHILALCQLQNPLPQYQSDCMDNIELIKNASNEGTFSEFDGSSNYVKKPDQITSEVNKNLSKEQNKVEANLELETTTGGVKESKPPKEETSEKEQELSNNVTTAGKHKNDKPKKNKTDIQADPLPKDGSSEAVKLPTEKIDSKKEEGVGMEEESPKESPTTPSPVQTYPNEPKGSSPSTNKESVVVRLSNKIKSLEQNMSISSQYLEELSLRYKKQMEEMKTHFDSASQGAYERDLSHTKYIENLESQLEKLSNIVIQLKQEKDELLHSVTTQHLVLISIQVILFVVFMTCVGRSRERRIQPTSPHSSLGSFSGLSSMEADLRPSSPSRRLSVDSLTPEASPDHPTRCRRPSDGSINISGNYKGLMIDDETFEEKISSGNSDQPKKLPRSASNYSLSDMARAETASNSRKSKKLQKLSSCSAGVLFPGVENLNNSESTVPKVEVKREKVSFDIGREYIVYKSPKCHEQKEIDSIEMNLDIKDVNNHCNPTVNHNCPIPFDVTQNFKNKCPCSQYPKILYKHENKILRSEPQEHTDRFLYKTYIKEEPRAHLEALGYPPCSSSTPETYTKAYNYSAIRENNSPLSSNGSGSNGKIKLRSDNWQWYSSKVQPKAMQDHVNGLGNSEADGKSRKQNVTSEVYSAVEKKKRKKSRQHKYTGDTLH